MSFEIQKIKYINITTSYQKEKYKSLRPLYVRVELMRPQTLPPYHRPSWILPDFSSIAIGLILGDPSKRWIWLIGLTHPPQIFSIVLECQSAGRLLRSRRSFFLFQLFAFSSWPWFSSFFFRSLIVSSTLRNEISYVLLLTASIDSRTTTRSNSDMGSRNWYLNNCSVDTQARVHLKIDLGKGYGLPSIRDLTHAHRN